MVIMPPAGQVRRLAAGSAPAQRAAAEEAYFAHDRAAYEHLRNRGFFG